jgi:16S rRNA (guanine966-N2)-methyltransferase
MRIFSGTLRQKELVLPKNQDFRPTTSKLRMQVFNICQQGLEGAHMLDLFAGSGAMGFEAISRGAAHCTFVEKEKALVSALHQNIENLGLKNVCTVFPGDVISAIKKLSQPFSFVYIDPPYDLVDTPFFQEVLIALDQS